MPSGADVTPLDIYVNPELKKRLKGADLSTKEKLMAATTRALSDMRNDEEFTAGLRKCCRCIKRRLQWVVAHGGRISASSLVEKWARGKASGEMASSSSARK